MTEPQRFAFGKNWSGFLSQLDDDRIAQAETSLRELLGVSDLRQSRFLDLGSGSGLFSLAAARLGATQVVSIDYDDESVACTDHLRRTYAADANWTVSQGSVLDQAMMESLGAFDVVYSWGVLHHTGQMTRAIELASRCVLPGGIFSLAIYNDQGGASRRWLAIKRFYDRLPAALRPVWVCAVAGIYECKFAVARLLRGQNPLPFSDWAAKRKDRGMSAWYDWVDWVGGLPFEVATPEQIILPLRREGFVLENLRTVGNGWGCNEFTFRRTG